MTNEPTILWVDDEIELLKPQILFLKEKGYKVIEASNGVDALEKCKEEILDIVCGESGLVHILAARNIKVRTIDFDIVFVGKRGDPPAQHIRSKILEQSFDSVALALAEFQAILINHESVRQDRLERRNPRRAKRRQQRQLEPTTMLIGSFKIQIRRISKSSLAQHRVPR